MSDIIEAAVAALTDKLGGASFDGSAKFSIEGEGAIIIDGDGVRAGDDEADVTLSAAADTGQAILGGKPDPHEPIAEGIEHGHDDACHVRFRSAFPYDAVILHRCFLPPMPAAKANKKERDPPDPLFALETKK